jgi:predicted Zn-dependent protease
MGASATGLINPAFVLGRAQASSTPEPVRDDAFIEAGALCEVRRFREALGVLNRVVLSEPSRAEAWTLMTRAHLGRGENAEALSAARTAGELSQDSEPHRLATVALVALERFDEAADQAAEAVRRDLGDWRNFVEQARALVRIPERLSEARVAAQNAVQLAPHKVTPHLVAGQVEMAGGEIESAARAFRQVFTIDPANPNAYNELARLHLHGGGAKDGGRRRPLLRGWRPR